MAINKVKTGWQVDVKPEGRIGKRVRKTFRTQAEAKRFEAKIRAQAASGESYAPKRKDNRSLMDLAHTWHNLHGATLKDGESRLNKLRFIANYMGNPRASSVRPIHVAEYRQKRLAEGLTANTVNHDIGYFRAVLNLLIRMEEWHGENPFASIKSIRLPERELSYLTIEQIDTLFHHLDQSRNRHVKLMASLCLATGARWGEAQYLRSELVRNGQVTYVDTKNGRARSVPIPDMLYQQLKVHGAPMGRLFPQDAYQAFTNALKASDIELPRGQRTHVLRHTFASHFVINGGNLLTLQKIMGHQSIQMTMRYAHLAPDHLKEAITYGPKIFG